MKIKILRSHEGFFVSISGFIVELEMVSKKLKEGGYYTLLSDVEREDGLLSFNIRSSGQPKVGSGDLLSAITKSVIAFNSSDKVGR